MPTQGFVIVAHFRAKEDKIEALRERLLRLVHPTRAESGCIQYDLHQDRVNPAEFLFYEIWQNRAVWEQHMVTPHLEALKADVGELIEEPIRVWEMDQIEP